MPTTRMRSPNSPHKATAGSRCGRSGRGGHAPPVGGGRSWLLRARRKVGDGSPRCVKVKQITGGSLASMLEGDAAASSGRTSARPLPAGPSRSGSRIARCGLSRRSSTQPRRRSLLGSARCCGSAAKCTAVTSWLKGADPTLQSMVHAYAAFRGTASYGLAGAG